MNALGNDSSKEKKTTNKVKPKKNSNSQRNDFKHQRKCVDEDVYVNSSMLILFEIQPK